MPSYEMALILKALQKAEVGAVLKRACEHIMHRGGIIRSMENLGTRELPFKMTKHGQRHISGSYFVVNFDSSPDVLLGLNDELNRDVDVIRPTIIFKEVFIPPCKLTDKECSFGELANPDHEKRIWRGRILRNLKLKPDMKKYKK